jgi:hypothetical protein
MGTEKKMKLIRFEPFVQPKNRSNGIAFREPVPCVQCGAIATRQAIFQGSGYQKIEKYCDNCGPRKKNPIRRD